MAIIQLSKGRETIVDDDCYEALNKLTWYISSSGYATNRSGPSAEGRKTIRMHRMVFELHGVDIPSGMEVDHINHDRLDNRFENLRLTDRSHNLANRSQYPNRTGYRGVVQRENGKFRGSVEHKGKKYLTRQFASPEEAAHARDEIVKRLYGEFATLNFPT